ncbi:hypothetical protein AC249_AIPGENE10415 [Exaiptasia diaphana]|nr:hypothetical protein AC249_AIPGENE10415 [Exaiptasia diaphana]
MTQTTSVHINESDRVPDHCVTHALGDPKNTKLSRTCDHEHDLSCSSCDKLKSLFDTIENEVVKLAHDLENVEGDDMLFTCKHAIQDINNWKSHQLRYMRQDQARFDAIDFLDEKTVFITQDWAMKFLPQKYREMQADWFGKRGISWHISGVVRRYAARNLETQAFIHIAKNSRQSGRLQCGCHFRAYSAPTKDGTSRDIGSNLSSRQRFMLS